MAPLIDRPGRTGRLLTNFSWLAGGRTAGAVLALAATALAARMLGAEALGLVVMVHAAALTVRQLCNVKTAESVIRYGVPLAEEGRIGELKGLILRFARIDLVTAAVAAGTAGLLLLFYAEALGLPAELRAPAALYVLALLTSITGTARGTLRLLDRFGTLSTQLAIGSAAKLAGVLVLLLTPARTVVAAYLVVWVLAYFVEDVYTWWRAYRAFRTQYGQVRMIEPVLDRKEVRSFLFTTYWQSTLDAAPKQMATLIAGTILGSAGAALFSLARQLAEVVAKPVNLLRQVVYPDLARLWRNDVRRFVNVTWRTGAVTAGVGMVVVLVSVIAGDLLLSVLAGPEFAAAAQLLTLLLLSASIELAGASFRPASYVMGKAQALLNVQILATLLYLVAFVTLAELFGLNGVGLASLMSATVVFFGAGYLVLRGARERLRADRTPTVGAGSEA